MRNCYDSYILRVRHQDDAECTVEGLVEIVGTEGMRPFTNVHELWDILGETGTGAKS